MKLKPIKDPKLNEYRRLESTEGFQVHCAVIMLVIDAVIDARADKLAIDSKMEDFTSAGLAR